MIAVTGMHRSGTSCITGLLIRCGFSLGTSHPLIHGQDKDNLKGHFENLAAASINAAIIQFPGGTWCDLPSQQTILETGTRFIPHIQKFARTFNGNVIKDPRLCITASFWEEHCDNLTAIVFCLRNPKAVAESLAKRNGLTIEASLALWYEYYKRFFDCIHQVPVHIIDYDTSFLTRLLHRR